VLVIGNNNSKTNVVKWIDSSTGHLVYNLERYRGKQGLKTVTITCRPTKKHNGTTILLTTRLTRFYDGQLDMDPKMSRSILGKFIFKSPTQNNDRTTMEESESTFLHYQDWSNAPLRSISVRAWLPTPAQPQLQLDALRMALNCRGRRP